MHRNFKYGTAKELTFHFLTLLWTYLKRKLDSYLGCTNRWLQLFMHTKYPPPLEFISSLTIHFISFVKSYQIKLILKLICVAICTFCKEDIGGPLHQSSWLSVSPFVMLQLENTIRILKEFCMHITSLETPLHSLSLMCDIICNDNVKTNEHLLYGNQCYGYNAVTRVTTRSRSI